MSVWIRDAPAGQLLRWLTGNRVLLYPEEQPTFKLSSNLSSGPGSSTASSSKEFDNSTDPEKADVRKESLSDDKGPVVDWYTPTDPENPQNWSTGRKSFAIFLLCLYTFAVYAGSAIIVPAESVLAQDYNLSPQSSSLVLSIYVLGYGMGPLIFSPLSEIPLLGRNIPYIVSSALFLIMAVPASRVNNYPGLVVLRFIQGFVGSPVLATSGASIGDILPFPKLPYGMSFWVAGAFCGPATGPLLSGFAVMYSTWRWSMYELIIIGGVIFFFMFFFMPETNPETLLLHRARRLRKLTGNSRLQSQSEVKQGNLHFARIVRDSLLMPLRINISDPAVLFSNVYTSLIYAIFYSFFESFPLVYMGIYQMSLGIMGVVFVSLIIASLFGMIIYVIILKAHYEPYTMTKGIGVPEHRLVPAIYAGLGVVIALFWFGWLSRSSINWAVPTIGIIIYGAGMFIIIQCIFIYLPISYPRYAASIFSSNAFIRSAFAASAIHFSRPMYGNIGVDFGCTILGCLSFGCFLGVIALWYFGAKLRARSTFAETY